MSTWQTIDIVKEKPKFERECKECNHCCRYLLHAVEGHIHHPGKPCFYLGDGCTVYDKRPMSCRNYYCAYIQGILPEWMKPSICGILVSVEPWGPNKEFKLLRAIEADSKMTVEILSWLVQFSRENNVGLIYQVHGVWYYLGPDLFMDAFKDQQLKLENFNPFITDATA